MFLNDWLKHLRLVSFRQDKQPFLWINFDLFQVANEREVKAQVVLQFRSVTGKQHWIKRSLSATQQVTSEALNPNKPN